MTSFYTDDELKEIGFKSIGAGNLISRNVSIYGAGNISIGSYNRIDDFSILSGNISIGDHIHIAAGVFLFGGKSGIVLEDFVGISSRSAVYADSDDYSGLAMTNPTIPDEFRHVTGGKVTFRRHSLVGTGCTVLPAVTVGEGSSIGAMSLVSKSLGDWGMYVGIPCKRLKDRSRKVLELEAQFMAHYHKKA